MNRQEIKDAIIKLIDSEGVYCFDESTVFNADDYVNGKYNRISIDSKYAYLAAQGGYEQEFNGDLSWEVHNKVIAHNSSYYVRRERKVPFLPIQVEGKIWNGLEFDIEGKDVDNFSIQLKHNYICQKYCETHFANGTLKPKFNGISNPHIHQAILRELYFSNCASYDKHFYVALLSDINIKRNSPLIRPTYLKWINQRNINLKQCINNHLTLFRNIDRNYNHILLYNNTVLPNNGEVYNHIFILELNNTNHISFQNINGMQLLKI